MEMIFSPYIGKCVDCIIIFSENVAILFLLDLRIFIFFWVRKFAVMSFRSLSFLISHIIGDKLVSLPSLQLDY